MPNEIQFQAICSFYLFTESLTAIYWEGLKIIIQHVCAFCRLGHLKDLHNSVVDAENHGIFKSNNQFNNFKWVNLHFHRQVRV